MADLKQFGISLNCIRAAFNGTEQLGFDIICKDWTPLLVQCLDLQRNMHGYSVVTKGTCTDTLVIITKGRVESIYLFFNANKLNQLIILYCNASAGDKFPYFYNKCFVFSLSRI